MNRIGRPCPRIFDLSIGPCGPAGGGSTAGRYRAKVLRSPEGEAEHVFELPWKPEEVSRRLEELGIGRDAGSGAGKAGAERTGGSGRRIVEQAGAQVGEELFCAVFGGRVEQVFRVSLRICEMKKERLILRLRFDDDPHLPALPWEMLWDPVRRSFLAASPGTALVRYSEEWIEEAKLPDLPPIHILVLSACPPGLPPIDVEREWRGIEAALHGLVAEGRVVLDHLEKATASSLLQQLRKKRYHVLHFIGHGQAGGRGSGPALFFEGSNGAPDRLQQGRLRALLEEALRPAEGPQLKLVVLNSCDGARESGAVLLDSLASELVRLGVPAVVAMQFAISDRAARLFAGDLYRGLAGGLAIEQALGSARSSLLVEGEAAWATPVLYLRSEDGRLFLEEAAGGKTGGKPSSSGALAAFRRPLVWAGAGAVAVGLLAFFFLLLPFVRSFDPLRADSSLGLVDGGLMAASGDGPGAGDESGAASHDASDGAPNGSGDESGAASDESGANPALPAASRSPVVIPASDDGCPELDELPGLTFARIDGGSFLPAGESETVTVAGPFCIGRTEVTVDQWNRVMGDDVQERGDLPVGRVSWDDGRRFFERLNHLFGNGPPPGRFRFPSAKEWELAASAGSAGAFSFEGGEEQLFRYGNCLSSVEGRDEEHGDGFDNRSPVASFEPNGLGLFDVHGNVWEWTSDREGALRVRRGGAYSSKAENCRLEARDLSPPDRKWVYWGLRAVWEAE